MATCCAFRLRDMTACQHAPSRGSDVCANHADFYNIRVWSRRFLRIDSIYLLQGITYDQMITIGRLQKIIEYSLKSGKIVLTQEMVAALETVPEDRWDIPHTSLVDVFTVLCGTGLVSPLWNMRLFKHCIYTAMKMRKPVFRDVWSPIDYRLGPFLTNPFVTPVYVIGRAFTAYRNLMQRVLDRDTYYYEFLKECFAHPSFQSGLMMSDEIISASIANKKEFEELVRRSIGPSRRAEKRRLKAQADQIKEEMISKVWHPKNVERWLELGGWDLVEMMENSRTTKIEAEPCS